MGLTALLPERGRLDATVDDLGCGWIWEAVHRVRPPAELRCPECGHGLRAKVSPRGLRFFAHLPGALACALAEESMAHHLLKLELATAARAAGWTANLEVSGPDRAWRADVLASAGDRRIALEAQLAPITPEHIRDRTQRMAADGVPSVWFSDRPRPPWLGIVPSVRLASGDNGLAVVEGLARFAHPLWRPQNPVPIAQFMDWLFTGNVLSHRPRVAMTRPVRPLATVWTTEAHIRAEKSYTNWQEQQKRKAADNATREEELRRVRMELRAARERDEEELWRDEQYSWRPRNAGSGHARTPAPPSSSRERITHAWPWCGTRPRCPASSAPSPASPRNTGCPWASARASATPATPAACPSWTTTAPSSASSTHCRRTPPPAPSCATSAPD